MPISSEQKASPGAHKRVQPSPLGRACRALVAGLLASLLFAGCSQKDFGRPVMGSITDVVTPRRSTAEEQRKNELEALVRSQHLAKALAAWSLESGQAVREYHIGPDDVLEVGVLSLDEPGRLSKLVRTVTQEGIITLPWIGDVSVGGVTTREVEKRVRESFAERLIKDPQVSVMVMHYRSAPVVVTGAVAKPGVYFLNRNRRTVLEMLAEADGLSSAAGNELHVIRGGKELPTNEVPRSAESPPAEFSTRNVIMIDLKQLIDEGDMRLNVWVKSGDIVAVLPRGRGYVYVLGYVQRPGSYETDPKNPIGAMQAVAIAGGLSPTGRAQNTGVIRKTEDGQKVIPLDLTEIASGKRRDFLMEPGDTLVVGSSFLARLSEFIRPSASVGASFAPVP